MNAVIHNADSRGHANHGWLDSHHTFSFAGYYNPERVNFGALRVLNDDIVEGGMGFGTHPHDNMEIITIPLKGVLSHKDSMGHVSVIEENEVQVMSAGTGITHSEYNHDKNNQVNFLQIWVMPAERNVKPRYDQRKFNPRKRINNWQRIVSPKSKGDLWINQDAYFSRATIEGSTIGYELNQEGNGVYIFVINGKIRVVDQELENRDGIAITGLDDLKDLEIQSAEKSEILLMEIPA